RRAPRRVRRHRLRVRRRTRQRGDGGERGRRALLRRGAAPEPGVRGGHPLRREHRAGEERRRSPHLPVRRAGAFARPGGAGEIPPAGQEPAGRNRAGDHPRAGRPQEGAPPMKTRSGVEIKPVYGPEDVPAPPPPPGEFPYTRGIHRSMYLGKLWTMRQYAGFGTPRETKRRFRYLLDQGQTGLSLALDLPTQLGLHADDPEAEGEVGKVGVSIGSLADMEELFQEIPLGEVSTSMTINATAPVLLALYELA